MTPCAAKRQRGKWPGRLRAWLWHGFRLVLFVAVCVALHLQHQARLNSGRLPLPPEETVRLVQQFVPEAVRLESRPDARGRYPVLDAQGQTLAWVLFTLPQSRHVVGFVGPANVMVVLDAQERIAGVQLLSSGDTPEHVRQVQQSGALARVLVGRRADQVEQVPVPDGVSGATLTFLAAVESVRYRLTGRYQGLRFPSPLQVEELRDLLPSAHRLEKLPGRQVQRYRVLDRRGKLLGWAVRGSPATDRVVGYQGPNDLLLVFDPGWRLLGFKLRQWFDNQPYVDYVRQDPDFQRLFQGRTLDQLAQLDLEEAEIEGVSGATMTSMAVAQGLVVAAEALRREQRQGTSLRWSAQSGMTAAVILAAVLVGYTPLRRKRWATRTLQLLVLGYLGFYAAEMLSLVVLVGWVQNGVPWRLGPTLAGMGALALLLPALTGRNWYCHHACPFGAWQMLLRRRVPWQLSVPRRWEQRLRRVPGMLVMLVVGALVLELPLELAQLEPFHAFLWRLAGWGTLSVFLLGTLAALVRPLAYCRYGCPTGRVLQWVRFQRHAARPTWSDAGALLLVAVSWASLWF